MSDNRSLDGEAGPAMKDFLQIMKNSASAIGAMIPNLAQARRIPTHPRFVRTGKQKKGRAYRHIIRYELARQHIGDRVERSEFGNITTPLFRTRHEFLHATKGWRSYAHVPAGMGR